MERSEYAQRDLEDIEDAINAPMVDRTIELSIRKDEGSNKNVTVQRLRVGTRLVLSLPDEGEIEFTLDGIRGDSVVVAVALTKPLVFGAPRGYREPL